MLECDLKLEMAAIPDLKDAIAYAEDIRDYVSRDLFLDILEEAIQDGRATSISPNEVHTILRTALADNRITLERVLNFLSSYNQVPSFHTQVEDEFKFYCSLLKEAFETLEEGQSNVLEHLKGRNNPALANAICYLLNETNPFKHMDEFYLNNFKYFLMNQCTPSHISGDTYREYASSALSHMISKERLNEADLDKVWSHIEKTMPSEDVRLLKRRFGYDLTSSEAQ